MRRTKTKAAKRAAQRRLHRQLLYAPKKTFLAHAQELRRRIFWVAFAVVVGGSMAYGLQGRLIQWLLQPAGQQRFIYTTPGGGIDFQLTLCLYAGAVFGVPFATYHQLRFARPLLSVEVQKKMRGLVMVSSLLAMAGVWFGYYVGLPPAMHFLLQSFSSGRISALVTIQSYLSFVAMYLLAAALLFQLPLVLLTINHVRPLHPRTLLRQQRWWIIGALVAGAVITPTADIGNQLLLSGPIVGMYELSVLLVWLANRRHPRKKRAPEMQELLERDREAQTERRAIFQKAYAWQRQQISSSGLASRQMALAASSPVSYMPQTFDLESRSEPPASTSALSPADYPPNRSVRRSVDRKYIDDFTRFYSPASESSTICHFVQII